MKSTITLISALLFSTLFYKQDLGLNMVLFTILTITVLFMSNKHQFIRKKTILIAIAYLITGVCIFLFDSSLCIIANITAFLTLIGSVSEHKSSIHLKWINGFYSTIVSSFARYYDSIDSKEKSKKKYKIDFLYWIKIIGIPTIVAFLFIALYRNGNPKFDILISSIDLSFINFQWILLAGLGYYLFNNIAHPIKIQPLTTNDKKTSNKLKINSLKKVSQTKLKSENQLAKVLLSVLTLLIFLFLITDILYLSEIHTMNSIELSQQVHLGINALIISIIFAIIIILYFFRGNLNFIKNNKNLKNLTYLWILLNMVLVLITAIKNYEYVSSFGFTYKRIGVLIYLFLTLIGLTTTFIKVLKIRNLLFLFRKNAQIAFFVLIISSTINWDKFISYYNLQYAEQTDMEYLLQLSNNNTFLLKDFSENNQIDAAYKLTIDKRHREYIENLNQNTWQEMNYNNLKLKN